MNGLKRLGVWMRDFWLIVGNTLLFFLVLELGLGCMFAIRDKLHSAEDLMQADSSWYPTYARESHSAHELTWHPYVYWRRSPFKGETINVDANGIRSTVRCKVPVGKKPVKIFMFGGSTMWGTGARDAYTIPSLLVKDLQAQDIAAEVTNFGETGYVNTHSLITLMLQLRQHNVPDLVIFYDGVNDTFSAYQQNRAGIPQNEFNRVREFNLSREDQSGRAVRLVVAKIARKLSTGRLARAILHRTGRVRDAYELSSVIPSASTSSDWDALAQAVVDTYAGNLELVKTLSERYGFRYQFYWQPTIFDKRSLAGREATYRERKRALEPFFERTNQVVRQLRLEDEYPFRDLSRVFADEKAPVYLDWVHLSESGNELVAKEMLVDVLRAMQARQGQS